MQATSDDQWHQELISRSVRRLEWFVANGPAELAASELQHLLELYGKGQFAEA